MTLARRTSILILAAAIPVALVGCGSSGGSDASSAADATTKAAAGQSCPEITGAVSQVVTFANVLDVPVTLSSPEGTACDNSAGPVFSGSGNPSQLSGVELAPGAKATAVTFAGKPNARGSFELGFSVPGGIAAGIPWSLQVRFGASDGAGTVLGWEEGYEKFLSGPCVETFTSSDGALKGMVNVVDGTVTFTTRDDAQCA